MGQIRKLPRKDFVTFAKMMINAFPGFPGYGTPDKATVDKLVKLLRESARTDPVVSYFGCYDRGQLIGGIRFFDFTMNVFNNFVLCGGGSLLGIDLMHKKEKIAKELMTFYIDFYLKKKAPLTALYPFRPDFYHKMGWGYGAKLSQYVIKPAELPAIGDKSKVRFFTKKDWPKLRAGYDRYAAKTHGMFKKLAGEIKRIDMPNLRSVVYEDKGKILGYLVFTFKSDPDKSFVLVHIKVSEFIYENREAFWGLIAFLRSQADQIDSIVLPTYDDNFHFLPSDPRNHSGRLLSILAHEIDWQGLGIMYRVIDTPGLFRTLKNHNFNNQTCRMKITISDSFLESNNKSFFVSFKDGRAEMKTKGNSEVEIRLDVAEFSSMILGVIDFKSLYLYKLAEISNIDFLETVNKIFLSDVKPITTTQF